MARAEFADILNRAACAEERVILHRHRKPVAALVSLQDLAILEQIEHRADLDEVRKRLKEPSLPWSRIKKELGWYGLPPYTPHPEFTASVLPEFRALDRPVPSAACANQQQQDGEKKRV